VAEPGLSFVGLHFLHAMSSAMIHGVGRDAEYIAERIAADRSQDVPAVRRDERSVDQLVG
jgi:putative flavoprotein involved in K+ transport